MRENHRSQLLIILQTLFLCSLAQLQFPTSFIKIPDPGITFYYEFNEENKTVLMGLDMDHDADYFAIGFADEGNYRMSIFDIVAFVFIPTGPDSYETKVLDLYTIRTGHPPTDVSLGGTDDYHLIDSYVSHNKRQVLFERAYDTGDKFDYLFDPSKTKDRIVLNWAWNYAGENDLSYHEYNAGTIISQMYNGFQRIGKNYYPGLLPPSTIMAIHGYVMLIGWGFIIEIAIQIGRYRKFSKNFILLHFILTFSLYALTVLLLGFAIYIRWEDIFDTIQFAHLYIGIITLILSTIQVLLGLILRFKLINSIVTHAIPKLVQVHLRLGIAVYIVTKIQITIGLYIFKPDLLAYLYIYFLFLAVFRFREEYLLRTDGNLNGKTLVQIQGQDSQLESHQKLMELLNSNSKVFYYPLYKIKAPVSQILETPEVKDLKWAILDDKVFNIKVFTHPGGNFILDYINGREVGRFIYGAYSIEALNTPETQHKHSKQALLIMQKNFIGTIQSEHRILIPFVNNLTDNVIQPFTESNLGVQQSLLSRTFSNSPLLPVPETAKEWTLKKKTPLTSLISQFEFKSREYYINPWTKDIRHLGQHMKVTFPFLHFLIENQISHVSHPKIRLYTVVLSQTEPRVRRRKLLWDKTYNLIPEHVESLEDNFHLDTIPLIIKKYESADGSTFSSFLHSSETNTTGFIIEGPFGVGLGLTPESSGLHYIFAAGTGILPFLDLFDFLLEALLENNHNNVFKNGFKLHVFGSFAQIDDFIGLDICEKLAKACRDNGLKDAFRMTLRIKSADKSDFYVITKESFDHAFIQKSVNPNCEAAYICGPPVFNQQISASLALIGIANTKITLV